MIDVEEFAKRLGLSVSTVRRMIHDGDLPAYRIGRKHLRVKIEDLESYIDASRVKPGVEDDAPKASGQDA